MTYDPGADLIARYPDWMVVHATLGWGIPEAMSRRDQVILLATGQTAGERRSSLAHAVAHLDLDHWPVSSGFFDLRQEVAADRLAARRLMPVERLAEVLAWTHSDGEVAEELVVDAPMLAVRLRWLERAERAAIKRVMSRRGGTAA